MTRSLAEGPKRARARDTLTDDLRLPAERGAMLSRALGGAVVTRALHSLRMPKGTPRTKPLSASEPRPWKNATLARPQLPPPSDGAAPERPGASADSGRAGAAGGVTGDRCGVVLCPRLRSLRR